MFNSERCERAGRPAEARQGRSQSGRELPSAPDVLERESPAAAWDEVQDVAGDIQGGLRVLQRPGLACRPPSLDSRLSTTSERNASIGRSMKLS